MKKISIGGGQGFWGDSPDAAIHMIRRGNLNYMACDYLAELTLSIMQRQKMKNPAAGYARDFISLMREVGRESYEKKIGVITNAGGMNIPGAVEALKAVAEEQEMHGYKIGYVTGDDLLDDIPQMIADGCEFKNMDDVGDFNEIKDKLVNANVYFGREPIPDSLLFLCSFKNMDFRDFADCQRHWAYEACSKGLNTFYESFQARLNGVDMTTNRKFLVFDEWAAFVLSQDKKVSEEVKRKLSTLLMMGRGVQHHVILGLQRADAQLFPLGGRDQFGAILALGNLSKEQKLMLFPDSHDDMTAVNRRGEGYLSLDGEPLKCIRVPTVTNVERLNAAIRDGLTR